MKKRFNVIYNDDKDLFIGEGWYMIYEDYDGRPNFEGMWFTIDHENADYVHVSILERMHDLVDRGWTYDIFYGGKETLKKMFQ